MKIREAMSQLHAFGTAQNRKIWARHGVKSEMFGVSFANLGKMKKKIKTDHALAEELWKTKNHDARVLAMMVADPEKMTARKLDSWVKALGDYVLTDAFSGLASQSSHAHDCMDNWIESKGEFVAASGWNVLCRLAADEDGIDDEECEEYLELIEDNIQDSSNRVRHSMNQALISIGVRNASLKKKAVAAARRIGKVEVDHGETGCKTPDAVSYIEKTLAYRKKKAKTKKKVKTRSR